MDIPKNLAGKRVLITGSTGHVGSALAKALMHSGAHLYLTDLNARKLDQLSGELEESNFTNYETFAADFESSSSREELVAFLSTRTSWLDGLVHNAALVGTDDLEGWGVRFQDQSLETWQRALEINLTAPFHLTQMLLPMLDSAGGASVVAVGSIHGVVAPDWSLYEGLEMGSPAAYSVSKAALIHLMKWLSTSLGPKVRCNSVSPGGLARGQDLLFHERYEQRVPTRRMGAEGDVVSAILYFLSDDSSYTSGQNLVIDGGYSVW